MKKIASIIFISILSLFAIQPLFHAGFFPVHDNAQVSRVYEMTRAISDGMFPVRWSEDFGYGYGYPVFNFYAPMAYYIGSAVMFLTASDPLVATKIMIGLGIVFSGICMYLLAREFWGEWGGIVAGLLYLYTPYHAVDIYVRGDIAESWAYALIPLVFYGLWKSHVDQRWRYIFICSMAFAGIIVTHNLTALMISPFVIVILIYWYIKSRKDGTKQIYSPMKALIIGLFLSAFYTIPVFFEIHFTNVLSQTANGFDFHKHFVCWSQFWYSPWGYGGSVAGCHDGLSFMIGKMHSAFAVFAIILAVCFSRKEKSSKIVIASAFALAIGLVLTTQMSQSIWEAVPLMPFFQFPWRFLIIIAFFSSFMSGFIFFILRKYVFATKEFLFIFISFFIAVVVVVFNGKFFAPKVYYHETAEDFTNRTYIAWNLSNDAHEYMPKNFPFPRHPSEIPLQTFVTQTNSTHILSEIEKTQRKDIVVQSKQSSKVYINLAYYPAWNVFVDGKMQSPVFSPAGAEILLPPGTHMVSAVFLQTRVEKIADIISIIGILFLVADIIRRRKNLFD